MDGGDVPEIISLYVTSECDPRLAYVLSNAVKVQTGMQKYLHGLRFNRKAAFDRSVAQNQGQIKGRPHYGQGAIQMDGIFQFRFASGYGYYNRDLAANSDDTYLKQQAQLYCGMSYLESQHAPAVAEHRNFLAHNVKFPGVFPGLDKTLCPAMSVGASIGYACDGHNDSSIPGLTESIFWTAPDLKGPRLPVGEKWGFLNVDAGLLFDLGHASKSGGACMYIPGSVAHNSMPSRCGGHTRHQGMGFVLVNKASMQGPKSKQWFAENGHKLLL
jgi:hypothetical protein